MKIKLNEKMDTTKIQAGDLIITIDDNKLLVVGSPYNGFNLLNMETSELEFYNKSYCNIDLMLNCTNYLIERIIKGCNLQLNEVE